MEEERTCKITEQEIKEAIAYWLSNEKGRFVKRSPEKELNFQIDLYKDTSGSGGVWAKCELELG